MREPRSHYFESNHLRLHYLRWAEDDSKPALILLHGGQDHAHSWDFVAELLLDRFSLYGLDLRGHGDSDWSTGAAYGLADHVLDLATLVRKIGRPVALIGHSLGGEYALEFALTMPASVSKVVSIEGIPARFRHAFTPPENSILDFIQSSWRISGNEVRTYSSMEEAAERLRKGVAIGPNILLHRNLENEVVLHLARHGLRLNQQGSYSWKFDNLTRLHGPYRVNVDQSQTSSAPVLLVCGSKSTHPQAEIIRQVANDSDNQDIRLISSALSNVQVEEVENAGHWVHHDQQDKFLALVGKFLDGAA